MSPMMQRSRPALLVAALLCAGSSSQPSGGLLDPVPEPAALPAPAAAPAPAPAPVAPKPIHWSRAALRGLVTAIDASAAEGLDPAAYDRDRVAALAEAGDASPEDDAFVSGVARGLARDFAMGRARGGTRDETRAGAAPAAVATLDTDLAHAAETGEVADYLRGLLPRDPRYVALRDALAHVRDDQTARRAAIRASMERWRWLPRTLGDDYLLVNIPAYTLTLYRAGEPAATHAVVVGAPKTPTPELVATAERVVVNPWWTLPPSVLAEGNRYPASRGFVTVTIRGKRMIRQKPGPANALGRIKIDMPNDHAIYLHDTPARWAFAKPDRALSHGCIRVQGIEALAAEIADPDRLAAALKTRETRTLTLPTGLPIYIAYFTAEPGKDGRIVTHADPYGRDSTLLAALDGSGGATRLASR